MKPRSVWFGFLAVFVFLAGIGMANAALNDNNTHYWKFDTSSQDIIGGLASVDTNISYQTTIQKINGSAYFRGSSHVSVGTSSQWDVGNNPFTLAGWFYKNSSGNSQGLFTSGDAFVEGNQRILLEAVDGTGVGSFSYTRRNSSGSSSTLKYYPSNLPVGNWYHVAAIYNTTHILLYINGTLVNSTAATGTIGAHGGSSNACFGSMECDGAGEGGLLNGYMDEWGFWNGTALTSADITSLYNNGVGCSYPYSVCTVGPEPVFSIATSDQYDGTSLSNFTVYFDGVGNVANGSTLTVNSTSDLSGFNNTVTNAAGTSAATFRGDLDAYKFNGSQYMNVSDASYFSPFNSNKHFAWRWSGTIDDNTGGTGSNGRKYIFSKGNTGQFEWEIYRTNSSDGSGVYCSAWNLAATSQVTVQAISGYVVGQQYNVTCVANGTHLIGYANGALVGSNALTLQFDGDGTYPVNFGTRGSNTGVTVAANVTSYEHALWNTSLTSSQVSAMDTVGTIPTAGLVLYTPFINWDNGTRTVTVGASSYFNKTYSSYNTSSDLVATLFQAQLSFNATELVSGLSVTGFTVTAPNGKNANFTGGSLYLKAGTYNLTWNKTGWYNKTLSFTVSARQNNTETFSAVYKHLFNITLRNGANLSFITSFSGYAVSANYDYNISFSTSNGSVQLPWADDNVTLLFTPSGFANATSNTSTPSYSPSLTNVTGFTYQVNTVFFSFRDLDTQALINQSINISIRGTYATYNYSTSNGTILVNVVVPDTYEVVASSNGYNQNRIFVTTANDYQNVTMYLDSGLADIIFIIQDTLGDAVPNATATFSYNVNGTMVTFTQCSSDFAGYCIVSLDTTKQYYITIIATGYNTWTGTVNPQTALSPYTISLSPEGGDPYQSVFNDVRYLVGAFYVPAIRSANITFDVYSGNGSLQYFGMTTTFNGTTYTANTSGIPGGGTQNFTIPLLSSNNTINVTFWIKAVGYDEQRWSEQYYFSGYGNNTYGLPVLFSEQYMPQSVAGRALLGAIFVIGAIALGFAFTGLLEVGALMGVAVVGFFTWPTVAIFPLNYGLLAIVTIIGLLIADNLTNR